LVYDFFFFAVAVVDVVFGLSGDLFVLDGVIWYVGEDFIFVCFGEVGCPECPVCPIISRVSISVTIQRSTAIM
jgi:hypothetical protein